MHTWIYVQHLETMGADFWFNIVLKHGVHAYLWLQLFPLLWPEGLSGPHVPVSCFLSLCFEGDRGDGPHSLALGTQQDTIYQTLHTEFCNLVLADRTWSISQELRVGKIFRNKLQCLTARMINWHRLPKMGGRILCHSQSLKTECALQSNASASGCMRVGLRHQ